MSRHDSILKTIVVEGGNQAGRSPNSRPDRADCQDRTHLLCLYILISVDHTISRASDFMTYPYYSVDHTINASTPLLVWHKWCGPHYIPRMVISVDII